MRLGWAADDVPRSCVSTTGAAPGRGGAVRARAVAQGKFFYAGREKVWVKGASYGTFRPSEAGYQFPGPDRVQADFAAMAASGINTVRLYTVPPRWLLDAAAECGLRVLVGLPWEQHVAFLRDRHRRRSIERRVRAGVRACAGHPAVLGYSVGNEVPAAVVRWHGRRRMERFLCDLYEAAKEEDGGALVTYVNFPSTEYLDLQFLDFVAFNVFLEERERLTRYLMRLQNVAGDRPLVLTEIGLDSRRNGLHAQAEVLDWQVRSAFAAGCAGAIVFTWTDEWYVSYLSDRGDTGPGGEAIEDWDFGLVDRRQRPKPALRAVQRAFADAPLPDREWPRVSVVVCSYNGSVTIRRTCEGLLDLDYPDYDVIVVDDGSRDGTGAIASEYGFRVIRTENRGLSAARNTGFEAATGPYVAYIDDDAWPDRHWLKFLVQAFEETGAAAVGGPNIPPPDDSEKALAIARAPGGPIHVLLDDMQAEHLPGCNLAVRTSVLAASGGFDPRFRVAGDDVDLCWRLLDRGETIVYTPGAMVWHRRRRSIRGYLRQQRGYGRAEALLEQKWPEKYNAGGHRTWAGRIYAAGVPASLGRHRWRVYYGSWGAALFQRLYPSEPSLAGSLRLTPEWWLLLAGLGALALLAAAWAPLLFVLPLLLVGLCLSATEAVVSSGRTWPRGRRPLGSRATTAGLYIAQPIARLVGRLGDGLTPWRRRGDVTFALPLPRSVEAWSEDWHPAEEWLRTLELRLGDRGIAAVRGGDFDRWDLRMRGGMLASAQLSHLIEEHGAGRQLARFRITPRLSRPALVAIGALAALGAAAARDGALLAAGLMVALAFGALLLSLREAGRASGSLLAATGVRHGERQTGDAGLDAPLLGLAHEAPLPTVASKESA